MKSSSDPRHTARIHIVKSLYAYSFDPTQITEDIKPIVARIAEIDARIGAHTTIFDTNRINKVDLAILRLGVFELEQKGMTHNIVIDEAIEIAKEYGADASSSFVNAVLSAVAKETL